MHIPIWKKWLSYLTTITLEEASSEVNPSLAVTLDKGRFQLLSNSAIYSWDDLYENFMTAFQTIDFQRFRPQEVLVLGLGLGSIPFMLEKKFGQKPHFTCVELDEVVAEWALKYTFSRMKSSVEIITTDAAIFVEVCEERYDLIIIDIFVDDVVPTAFEQAEFLHECQRLLAADGLLMYNRLFQKERERNLTERFYDHTFKSVFPEALVLETAGNWVLVNRKP